MPSLLFDCFIENYIQNRIRKMTNEKQNFINMNPNKLNQLLFYFVCGEFFPMNRGFSVVSLQERNIETMCTAHNTAMLLNYVK